MKIAVECQHLWKIFSQHPATLLKTLLESKNGIPDATTLLEQHQAIIAVQDINLSIKTGEVFCIMGLSGSGKSTLIRHFNRLIEPTQGSITIFGTDILQLNAKALRQFRAEKIGMVFQHMALFPHYSALENVAYPLQLQRVPIRQQWEKSYQCLEQVGLAGFELMKPNQLSGGMQQRVGLARALASDPELLLMDEPFSALDPLIRQELQIQFKALSNTLNKTTLFITHDIEEALTIGDRIGIMKDGKLEQVGTPEEIVNHPANDYVKAFIETRNQSQFKRSTS